MRDIADQEIRRDAKDVASIIDANGEAIDEESRRRLIDRHEWIGRLAAVLDRAPGDPQRAAVVAPAQRSAAAVFIFFGLIVIAVLLGIALLITALVMRSAGSLRFCPTHPASANTLLLEAFTVYLALMALSMTLGALNLRGGPAASALLILLSFAGGLTWPLIRGMPPGDFAAAMGLNRFRSVIAEAFWGAVGYIALLPLVVVGVILTLILQRSFGANATHPISEMLTGPLGLFIFLAVMATVFAPITEELLFRGALFGYLRTRVAWIAAAIIVGVIFASIHPQGWAGIPVLSAIGFNLAVLRQWRGSIIAPIVAHALNNGTVVLMTGLMLR
jgi:membrane protease YdiL (CAAX protease family)